MDLKFIPKHINGGLGKLKIKFISGLAKEILDFPKKYSGFMGISIYNYFFTRKTMEKYILWGSKNLKEFIILLMDDPEVSNLHIFKKIDKKTALQKSRSHADSIKICLEKIIEKNFIKNTKILCFRDFNLDKKYLKIEKIIFNNFKKDLKFKEDLINLMFLWIGDKIKSMGKEITSEELEELSKYIKKELASLLYFTEKGYKIELDPTPEFSTKRNIYEGIFEEIKRKLKLTKRGHIYLHPEGIEKYGKKKIKEIMKNYR